MPTPTRLHRIPQATPERGYRAFLDPGAMAKWLPPNGFTGRVNHMNASIGGSYKMPFTYVTTGKSLTFGGEYLEGKYLELVPHERIRHTKDRLVEALVLRSAENWRGCYMGAYERTSEGPGRMVRALLDHCLSDAQDWTAELRCSTCACFAALAQNPALIEPMREVYSDLHQRVAEDGLPPGVGEAIAAAIDGLWLYWVLGLATVDQDLVVRVRRALEDMLARSQTARSSPKTKPPVTKRSRGHRS